MLVFTIDFIRFLLIHAIFIQVKAVSEETVLIQPNGNAKYFDLPTSDESVVSWIDIQKGIFPNTSQINSFITVGEPITMFVYLKDMSYLYDIKVTDCWAYDDKKFSDSKNKLHLMEEHLRKKTKLIDKWHKRSFPPGQFLKTMLYANLTAFKFPDKDQIYMTCDIQLCFKTCDKASKL